MLSYIIFSSTIKIFQKKSKKNFFLSNKSNKSIHIYYIIYIYTIYYIIWLFSTFIKINTIFLAYMKYILYLCINKKNMEENNKEEIIQQEDNNPTIEVIKPVKTNIVLNGYAKREDNTYIIRWFDNTDKVLYGREFQYFTYDFMQSLNEAAALYQLNSKLIISIKLSTI